MSALLRQASRPLSQQLLGRCWDPYRLTAVWTLAIAPATLVMLLARGLAGVVAWSSCALLAVAWQYLFARLRRRRFLPDGWLTASAVVVLAGTQWPLWQLWLALSFAVVLGEQVFGGRGRYLVNPAALALCFLPFSFATPLSVPEYPGLLTAVLFAAVPLLGLGLLSWRSLMASALGFSAILVSVDAVDRIPALAPLLFFALFVAADPVATASTPLGRWLHGVLLGALAAALSLAGPEPGVGAWASAALLAALFAPLLDRLAIVWMLRGRSAHGQS